MLVCIRVFFNIFYEQVFIDFGCIATFDLMFK